VIVGLSDELDAVTVLITYRGHEALLKVPMLFFEQRNRSCIHHLLEQAKNALRGSVDEPAG
jgi:hypothetical protein